MNMNNNNENGGFPFLLLLLLLLFSATHSMPLATAAVFAEVHAVFPVVPLQDGPLAMMANFHPSDRCNFHHRAPGKMPDNRGTGQNAAQMAPVEFRSGQKYLISTQPLGSGATGQVFHAILIGNKWKTSGHRPPECVAIKVGDDEIVAKEAETLHQIWLPQKYAPFNKTPQNILRFIRSESFYAKPYNPEQAKQKKKKGKGRRKQTAIVMELGMQNLAEYWAEAMPIVMRRFIFCDIDEGMLIRIMRQIGLALVEVHQRDYLFVDLKWDNVMVMPGSPTPKELCNENGDKLLLKITDFGAALKFRPKNRGAKTMRLGRNAKLMATPFFRAPEIFDEVTEKEIGPGTDIFSLGRLMLLLAVQTPEMRKWVVERGLLEIIRECRRKRGDDPQEWLDLVDAMLTAAGIQPERFPGAEDDVEGEVDDDERKWGKKAMAEEGKEAFRRLYNVLEAKYGKLVEIIKQTQAEGQEDRPSALEIVEHCNSLLNHHGQEQIISPSGQMTPGGGHRRTASMVGMVRRQFSHSFRRFKSFSMEMNPF